ncbi:phytanoyl-CoA dioxygenase family protein [Kitasatospora sp. NPDC001574]
METVTPEHVKDFRNDGYVVVPGVLAERQVDSWRALVARFIDRKPPDAGRNGPYFLWPGLAEDPQLRELYRDSAIAGTIRSFLGEGLGLPEPEVAQLAVTLPPYPRHPGAPHLDGLTPTEEDGRPGTFTVLAGLLLTDQRERDRGNLWVWPGTHLRTGAWLREHGAHALATAAAVPYPPVELGEPVQIIGAPGSLVLVHYLLAHNIGGHFGTDRSERRESVYFRLRADGHRGRWRDVVTDPLLEFAH